VWRRRVGKLRLCRPSLPLVQLRVEIQLLFVRRSVCALRMLTGLDASPSHACCISVRSPGEACLECVVGSLIA
jgi:hypothetical protein